MTESSVIGIDLGTSYFSAAVFNNDKIEIIPNDIGEFKTPSYIAFTDNGILIGTEAKNQIHRNPTNTIFDLKRLVGKRYNERELEEKMKLLPFKIVSDYRSDLPLIIVNYKKEDKKFYVQQLLEFFFQKIKKNAIDFLKKEIKDVVINVPNYFNLFQRETILEAAKNSGFNVRRLINDTDSIALAYIFDNFDTYKNEKKILIINLGGGILNISIVDIEDGIIEVKTVNGNINLGGEDFDNRLVWHCCGEFKRKTMLDIKSNARAFCRIKKACEKAKEELSFTYKTIIHLDSLLDDKDFDIEITRSKFEYFCLDLFKKIITSIENILKDAKISKNDINDIILVGGSMRIPKIKQIIKEFFDGKEPLKNINLNESVVYGSAIYASITQNIKNEKFENIFLLSVIPFSFGIETKGGKMAVLIPKNSNVPTKKTKTFYTIYDYQESIKINIFEGENKIAKDNFYVGYLFFSRIPPMPKGEIEIQITFDLYFYLNVFVSTYNRTNRKRNDFKGFMNKNGKLSSYSYEKKYTLDTESYDQIKNLEKYCDQIEQIINDKKYRKKFFDEEKQNLKNKLDETYSFIKNNPEASKEQCEEKIFELENILGPAVQKIYQLNNFTTEERLNFSGINELKGIKLKKYQRKKRNNYEDD